MFSNQSNDLTLPRANFNDLAGKLGDRRQWEADQKLVEKYK
jgi:hypothetical protein